MMCKNKIKLFTLMLGALCVGGCSDDMVMPENPDAPVVEGVGNDVVIYEANPRFFGDNNLLSAIDSRLDAIKGMGANVLWIMPVNTPGELNAIGSPYCVKDYKTINTRYGSEADFTRLVSDAHSKGMRVILDWVANHTSWDNAWITQHSDWYEHDANGDIVAPSGWTDVAQLDFTNASMRAAMIDAMVYWVKDMGVDGFRFDYATGVPHDFWQEAVAAIRAVNADALLLAETSDTSFYNDGFDMLYGWDFGSALQDLFSGKIAPAKFFSQSAAELANVPEGKSIMRYSLNHDVAAENDIATLYGSRDAVEAAYVLSTFVGGVPMLYSSMESTVDSGKLSFFNYNPLSWSTDRAARYATLGSIYSATTEVRGGELRTYQTGKVATFARVTPDHALIVAVNPTADTRTVSLPISYVGTQMQNMLTGSTLTVAASAELGAYEYLIYYK